MIDIITYLSVKSVIMFDITHAILFLNNFKYDFFT